MTAPAEPAAVSPPADSAAVTPAMRLQILTAEQQGLNAARSLAWGETFARTGMFLSTLSFGMVGLALVAQASDFGEPFRLFALAVLPVLLFLGIGTQLRLDSANYHDVLCIVGLNRIRAMYVRLAPDLEPVFVMGANDDYDGIERTMASVPGRSFGLALVAASPVQVAVLNAALFAAIVGLLAMQLGASAPAALIAGAAGFVAALGMYAWTSNRLIGRMMRGHRPLIPAATAGAREPDRG